MDGSASASAGNDGEWTIATRRKKRPAQRSLGDQTYFRGKEMKCEPDKGRKGASAGGVFSGLEISTFVEHGQECVRDVEISVEVTVEVNDGAAKGSRKSHVRMKDGRSVARKVVTVEERESRLLVQMHQARKMVEASPFYVKFLEQLRGLRLKTRIQGQDDARAVPVSQSQESGRTKGGTDCTVKRDASPCTERSLEPDIGDCVLESSEPAAIPVETAALVSRGTFQQATPMAGIESKVRESQRGQVDTFGSAEQNTKAAMDMEYSSICSAGLTSTVGGGTMGDTKERGLLIVVYGVGSVADAEVSRCQMALACLLASELQAEGRVEVFDPVLSPMESRVLASLGATTIPHNEVGSRVVSRPTIFFMPHCEAHLYENVLLANRECGRFQRMAVLGNSFAHYQQRWTVPPFPRSKRPDFLLKVQEHVEEHQVSAANFPVVSAFNDMSWHFFPNECAAP